MTPDAIADELTAALRTPAGTMRLQALQAECLLAGEETGGRLFTNAAVGLGKSLMLALLMRLCGGARPLILTEANIVPQMSDEFEKWARRQAIDRRFIQRGRPMQNGLIERFNRTYREEVLECYAFDRLGEVRRVTADWIRRYNNERDTRLSATFRQRNT